MLDAAAARILQPRINRSKKIIKDLLSQCERPYLSWSGGKDSTVMLWLTLQIKPDIEVIYFDADSCLPDGQEYMMRLVSEWSLNFRAAKTRPLLDVLAEYGIDHPCINYYTMKATVYEPVRQLAKEGYDGSLVGIRAQESRGRKLGGMRYGELFRNKSYDNMLEAWPMLWWTAKEIWFCIDYYKIPYHPAYDKTKFDPREEMRVSYWAGETKRRWGRFKWLEYYYPDLFTKFIARCPQVRNFL